VYQKYTLITKKTLCPIVFLFGKMMLFHKTIFDTTTNSTSANFDLSHLEFFTLETTYNILTNPLEIN